MLILVGWNVEAVIINKTEIPRVGCLESQVVVERDVVSVGEILFKIIINA